MQTIYFLEVLIYAGRQGKLDQEHLNTVYSTAIAVRGKKRIEGKTLGNQIGTVGLDQSIHLSSLVTHLSQAVLVKKGILSKKITDAYRGKEGILQTEVKYKIITFGLELHHLIKLKGSDQKWHVRGGNPL